MGVVRNLLHAGGTGGLNWHLHAHASAARWQPTLELIDQFLTRVNPGSAHLLLIGGSAGWMMPPAWLSRFQRIDAYDIDPFAPWLFNWRHGRRLRRQGISVQHHRQDALRTLPDILANHPNACIWFDNVLGQHRYRVRDEVRAEAELNALKAQLVGRAWGSLHDRLSGPTQSDVTAQRVPQLARHQVRADAVNDAYAQTLLRDLGAKDVWSDHLTGHVLPANTPTSWLPWAFRPQYWHWLQAGWVQP